MPIFSFQQCIQYSPFVERSKYQSNSVTKKSNKLETLIILNIPVHKPTVGLVF